jgi:serine phosphatase RsbU (regulator of sigma subunit)
MAAAGRLHFSHDIGARALNGASRSGDAHLVLDVLGGLLVSVVDGLGHGPEAALAANRAIDTLRIRPDLPALELIKRCHEALRGTRGAVLSLAVFETARRTLSWVGVGNVEGSLMRCRAEAYRRHDSVPVRGGIVGYRLPPVRVGTVEIEPGDVLVLATDGIRSGFEQGVQAGMTPTDMAAYILSQFGKTTDDALVLVGRWDEP